MKQLAHPSGEMKWEQFLSAIKELAVKLAQLGLQALRELGTWDVWMQGVSQNLSPRETDFRH